MTDETQAPNQAVIVARYWRTGWDVADMRRASISVTRYGDGDVSLRIWWIDAGGHHEHEREFIVGQDDALTLAQVLIGEPNAEPSDDDLTHPPW